MTISIYDPACQDVLPLERFLHVRYLGHVVFWGPIVTPEWNFDQGTVTINAIDSAIRMESISSWTETRHRGGAGRRSGCEVAP